MDAERVLDHRLHHSAASILAIPASTSLRSPRSLVRAARTIIACSKEYEIERLYREAAFMLIGEGTSDIQKMIIGRSLLKDYKLKG